MTNTTDSNATRVAALLLALAPLLVALVVMGAVRTLFVAKFCPLGVFASHADALPLFALNTLRYDAHIGAYAALPMALFALLLLARPQKLWPPFEATLRIYCPVEAAILALVALADVHWYNNFARHFDPTLFTVGDEEPLVLLRGVVSEAPWLMLTLGLAAALALALWVTPRLTRLVRRRLAPAIASKRAAVIAAIAVPATVGVAMRGSLGVFTIRREDCYVSDSQLLNDCVVNGPYALITAYKDRQRQHRYLSDDDIVRQAGFRSEQEAAAVWLGLDSAGARQALADGRLNADSALVARTFRRPKCPGMNVVVLVCESLGDKLLDYEQRYGLDLLGDLRRFLPAGGDTATDNTLLWRHHFLSADNGTIQAVETFATGGCPYPRLFESPARFAHLPLAPARVFAQAGYRTSFVSGIEIAWQNCQECLPRQGFQEVIGKMELLAKRPGAACNHTWGVYDHAMLDFLADLLADTAAEPRYVVALTSTNHTPFELPDDVALPPLELPDDPAAFAVSDRRVVANYLRGYQYTCASLARFLERLEASTADRRTIVAITGDHNTRYILPYADGELAPRYAVPLLLRAPVQLPRAAQRRAGSHLDIPITLANLTLADRPMLWLGQDLLADSLAAGSFAVNVGLTLPGPDADPEKVARRVSARDALAKLYFKRRLSQSR